MNAADVESVKNPEKVIKKRGRPKGSLKRANQRDKSHFEIATGNKCSNCGERTKHNIRTCRK